MLAFGVTFCLMTFLNIHELDKLIVIVSFPIILLIVLVDKILKRKAISFDWSLSINYISIFAIVIAVLSTILFMSYKIFPGYPLPTLNYLYFFYVILSIFSPVYLILISFNYPLYVTFRTLKKKWIKNSTDKKVNGVFKERHIRRRTKFFHLSGIVFLSIIVSMIPHVSIINKDNQLVGVDTYDYSKLLESMANSSGLADLLQKVFVSLIGGDRPFTLLFFLFLSNIFYQGNFTSMLENLPILLSPLLVVTVYFLTLGITRNYFTSIMAALITIPSHILIGIYGGLYANWVSLIWAYLAFLFLFKCIERPKRINFFVFSILLIMLLISHTPTWNIYMYVIGLFLIVIYFMNRKKNKKLVVYAILSVLPSISIDIVRMLLINTSGVKQEIGFAMQREIGFHGINTIWHNLIDTTHLHLAGQIGNPIILILILYWVFIKNMKENYTIFFIIFFTLNILPILFADKVIQARFYFEIPFQIPAAIALTVLKEKAGTYITFAICLWLICMSLYMTTNFVLTVPQ
jgi:hypothetical protein